VVKEVERRYEREIGKHRPRDTDAASGRYVGNSVSADWLPENHLVYFVVDAVAILNIGSFKINNSGSGAGSIRRI
jgi:hypothetical protein